MLGNQLLPFGYTDLSLVILPLEDKSTGFEVINKEMALSKGASGLHDWLKQVEVLWAKYKKTGNKNSIYQWLDYVGKLTSQHSSGYYTVLHNTSGTNLASCVLLENDKNITDIGANCFITDTDAYSFQTKIELEAHYLCSFLNSPFVDVKIKPYQDSGTWGARHIHRRPFEVVPIPKFDAKAIRHVKLAKISKDCHQRVAQMALKGRGIGSLRSQVRKALSAELAEIDKLVIEIIS